MNRTDARQIAETITSQQLADMLEASKNGIKDWTKRSRVNKGLDLGTTWNILGSNYTGQDLHVLAKTNMIWEFGDFLPDKLKPTKKNKIPLPEIHHQDPVF